MEHSPRDRRGRYGSFVPVSTFLAFASAALTAWGLERLLGAAAMADWGWRIPFLAAAPLGLIGLYLRLKLDETPPSRRWKRTMRSAIRRWARRSGCRVARSCAWAPSSR